ncbi:hypothetical protein [Blastococcus sp. URHD0036]|uniref:hypothetical protein n=1 Tax=Blastococcus sp. URHD0036 TaxID=1380356 RepID=UPI001E31AC30|nr:hypothetical protein [Blastococcus sp. URHD0036]
MSERDPYPATPHPGAAPQPQPQWESETTPGLQAAGNAPYSGTGASAVGAGWSGGGTPDGTETWSYPRQGEQQHWDRLHDDQQPGDYRGTTPEYSTAPVTLRRPDVLAGLLLVLAGIAAAASLLLEWAPDSKGWDLVRDGFEDFDQVSWQPPVIVVAGGALLVLGLLVLLPARGHRTLGVLALLATMAAAGGVLVVLDASRYSWDFFEVGFWVACAVPVLGLLGSLKAMLTSPRTR